MRPGVKFLLKAIVTFVLLAILVWEMDLAKFLGVLSSADLSLLALATLIQIGIMFLGVTRWQVILRSFNMSPGFAPLTKITFIGLFFSLFLPSSIGGDFFRAYYLSKREHRGMSTTLTSTFLERSAGLCALLALGIFFAARRQMVVEGVPLFYLLLAIGIAYVAVNIALFNKWIHKHITRFFKYFNLENVESKLELVYEGLLSLRKDKKAIAVCLALSLVIQFFSVVIMWIAALAIGVKAPFLIFLIFIPIVNLTIMIPLTINGFGLREGVYFLLFREIGLPVETAVTLSLLNFLVVTLASLPGAVAYSFYKKEENFDQILTKPEAL